MILRSPWPREGLLALVHLLHEQPERDVAQAADRVAEELLRVYGLSAEEAREVCVRPPPDLDDLAVGGALDQPAVTVAAMPSGNGSRGG